MEHRVSEHRVSVSREALLPVSQSSKALAGNSQKGSFVRTVRAEQALGDGVTEIKQQEEMC